MATSAPPAVRAEQQFLYFAWPTHRNHGSGPGRGPPSGTRRPGYPRHHRRDIMSAAGTPQAQGTVTATAGAVPQSTTCPSSWQSRQTRRSPVNHRRPAIAPVVLALQHPSDTPFSPHHRPRQTSDVNKHPTRRMRASEQSRCSRVQQTERISRSLK